MKIRPFSEMARRPSVRVTVTLPLSLLDAIDAEAERIGVARSALVEYLLTRQIGADSARQRRPGARIARAK